MENESLESAISLLNDEKVNKHVDILKNILKDSDLCTFEIGVYLLYVIRDKKRIYQNNLEKQSYDEQILKLNSCEESALYGLYSTDTFYFPRNAAYHECLKNIKTEKNDVSVEQIVAKAKEICSSNEEIKDMYYLDIFSRNDYLAEMEDDLKKEDPVAQMLDEMIDMLYKFQEKWGLSGKNINSHKLDKKIILQTDKDKGAVTAEFVGAQERHQKIAFAQLDEDARKVLFEAKKAKGEPVPTAEINQEDIPKFHFADISRILQQFQKLVIFKKYLLDDYEKDAINQKKAISDAKGDVKNGDLERYYKLYHNGRDSLLYLTRFVDHNNSQGAASVKTTLETFYALIPKIYQYLKTKNSDDTWFEFLNQLDGICLEGCCRNITDYCEKHPEIIDICIDKERKHSGIYVHKVLDLKYCSSIYDVACKVIMQLMDDYDRKGNQFFWDEVKDEIAYHVAEKKWSDADFSCESENKLINSKEFNELKIKLEENCVIQKNDKTNDQPSENIEYAQLQQNQIENENYDMGNTLLDKYDSADALLKDKNFDVQKIGECLENVRVSWINWFRIFFSSLGVCIRNLFNKNFKFSVYAKLVVFYEGKRGLKDKPDCLVKNLC